MGKLKKGNMLIESIIGMFILTVASVLIGSAIYRYYTVNELEKIKVSEFNIIEMIKKEIKYNLSLCELENLINEKNFYIQLKPELETQLLNVEIKDLFVKNEEDIFIEKIKNTESGIEIALKVNKYGFSEKIEKEKWMEK